MKLIEFDQFEIESAQGDRITFLGCSLATWPRYFELRQAMRSLLRDAGNLSIEQVVERDDFAALADEALKLNGIPPQAVNLDQRIQLLCYLEDGGGMVPPMLDLLNQAEEFEAIAPGLQLPQDQPVQIKPWDALDGVELWGADGQVHQVYGASIRGLAEIEGRLADLSKLLSSEPKSYSQWWWSSPQFRWILTRSLNLNGISLAMVTLTQAIELLLHRGAEGAGENLGHLWALNRMDRKRTMGDEGQPIFQPDEAEVRMEAIASIATHEFMGLEALTTQYPARQVVRLCNAVNFVKLPPREKEKVKQRRILEQELEENPELYKPIVIDLPKVDSGDTIN